MLDRLKSSITVFFKSKQVKNGIWMYLLQFFNAVIPMLTIPYITRILGVSMYGVFSIALNIISYMQVAVEYGFVMSATRKVAISNEENLNTEFTAVILSRLSIFTICAIASSIFILFNFNNPLLCKCFCALFICLIGYTIQMNWIFMGEQDMKYISVINIISRTISTGLIFLMVKSVNDIVVYSVLFSVSPLLCGIFGIIIAINKYNLRFVRISAKRVLAELKDGWYVFTTQLSAKVFSAIGITFLGMFGTEVEVGIFSAVQKIPSIMMLAWSPITQVLYPMSSIRMKDSFLEGRKFINKSRLFFVPLFGLFALIIAVMSKWLVGLLFGSEFVEGYYLVYPLLGWFVVAINNNFLGIQTLLGSGHDKEYSKCFQISVLCTIVLNFGLIKVFGALGASFAPLFSELILWGMLAIIIKRITTNYKTTE